ncbi:hypothetical protein ACLOJK_024521 [Asimina triloba]
MLNAGIPRPSREHLLFPLLVSLAFILSQANNDVSPRDIPIPIIRQESILRRKSEINQTKSRVEKPYRSEISSSQFPDLPLRQWRRISQLPSAEIDLFLALIPKFFPGKAAPMANSRGPANAGIGARGASTRSGGWNSTPSGGIGGGGSLFGDHDAFFGAKNQSTSQNFGGLDDIFGGPVRGAAAAPPPLSTSSMPVYDKPVYDDDIFNGVPGMKSTGSVKYGDVFSSLSSSGTGRANHYDDLLGGFGRSESESKSSGGKRAGDREKEVSGFDDLIPGFGGSSPPQKRSAIRLIFNSTLHHTLINVYLNESCSQLHSKMERLIIILLSSLSVTVGVISIFLETFSLVILNVVVEYLDMLQNPLETSEANRPHSSTVPTKSSSSVPEDPFVVLESSSVPVYSSSGLFNDPIEHLNNPRTKSTQAEGLGAIGSIFDAFEGLSLNSSRKDKSVEGGQNTSPSHATHSKEKIENPSTKGFENNAQKKVLHDDYQDSSQPLFDMPTGLSDSHGSVGRSGSHPKDGIAHSFDTSPQENVSPKSDENSETVDEAWLNVDEIPLFTQPTSAPPPSRPSPSWVKRTAQVSKTDRGSAASVYTKRNVTGSNSAKSAGISSIDELEDFAMGKPQNNADEDVEAVSSEEEREPNSAAAAAMKEAMDRAEAKFKHAREVRERERDAKSAKTREFVRPEGDEKSSQDAQEQEYRENQERLYCEQEQREMEEKEKELKRLERERERERIEQEKTRQAVERATREARERSAAEARAKHERAAVERAAAEARERERAAVQRVAAEARERLAAEAREKAEKVAAEARQKAAAEARQKAAAEAREKEKAAAEARDRAVENAATEVRARAERAKAERERAAREKQQRNENDLESFFGMGVRPSSAPRQRSATPSKGSADAAQRTSSTSTSNIRKTPSATDIVDDLTSIFGGAPSAGEFQEVEGESEERRRARLERHQRTLERAAKALAEKNERDMQTQRDQAERHRIAETLDVEIKRWAAGKEGNLRALLSTLQYVGVVQSKGGGFGDSGEANLWQRVTCCEYGSKCISDQALIPVSKTSERFGMSGLEKGSFRYSFFKSEGSGPISSSSLGTEREYQRHEDEGLAGKFHLRLAIAITNPSASVMGKLARFVAAADAKVLWPDCGWQPVSLTDLITAASVKKVYRKATLCIHPDKVQQKGANLQQKYIAEKVFDLLKV